ncbi:hypothetical protein F4818DRAFT_419284 [Hypoxylon cercidicola]|nr:hypothetical protein F4818DRAFT_419284 [Hypoxylon cercidicola]
MTDTLISDDNQSERSDWSDQDSEDDDAFAAVLSTIDMTQLPQLSKSVRHKIDPQYDGEEPVVGDSIHGSYHILFPLFFSGDVCWLVKIPANGTEEKWDDLSANALIAEANTMRLLKRDTTIPLPEVFDFSSTTDNSLRCPYIMMSFVTGKSLYDVWFSHRLHNDSVENVLMHRKKALTGIANAMAQLEKFAFDQGGSIIFDAAGNPSEIGPARSVDQRAMLDRWFIDHDPSEDTIYVENPVLNYPNTYYLFPLYLHLEKHIFPRGVCKLLRQLISWIPEPECERPFVLAHSDFDIQNFIVADDGELLAIIDWDGIAAVPRSVGNERYPGWLTRDWDPAMYAFDASMNEGVEPEGVWEDSPAELARCRALYRSLMKRIQEERGSSSDVDVTRMSLIAENLAIAAHDPRCRNDILMKLVTEISNLSPDAVQLDFMDLVNMFAEDKVDQEVMRTLRGGFENLLKENL